MLFEIIEQALVERNIHERKAFDNVFYSTVWFILAILRVDADPKCVSGIEVVLWFEKVGLKKAINCVQERILGGTMQNYGVC